MKNLSKVLKVLGYICVAYSICGWHETFSSQTMTINEVFYNAGLSAKGLKLGYIGLSLLLASEIIGLIKNNK